MNILALDPGITTGIAIAIGIGEYVPTIKIAQLAVSHSNFIEYLNVNSPSEIVYEQFFYQRRNKVELYPVEVIGVIKLFCQQRSIPIYGQSASQAKGFMTDDKIKKMGLWHKGQVHGMDALRHLLYHLIVTKGDQRWLNALRPD